MKLKRHADGGVARGVGGDDDGSRPHCGVCPVRLVRAQRRALQPPQRGSGTPSPGLATRHRKTSHLAHRAVRPPRLR